MTNITIEKAPGACDTEGFDTGTCRNSPVAKSAAVGAAYHFALNIGGTEPRVDSRLLAKQLRNQHRAVVALIDKYRDRFAGFGKVLFQKASLPGSRTGQSERFALLTEDQAFFLLSLARNTDHVLDLKGKLIDAFRDARRAVEQRGAEYMPTYRALHDEIAVKAAGSSNSRFVHANVNKLINATCGLEAGQRATMPLAQQSLLVVALTVAARAMQGAPDHRAGYTRAKQALQSLTAVAGQIGTT